MQVVQSSGFKFHILLALRIELAMEQVRSSGGTTPYLKWVVLEEANRLLLLTSLFR